jgi:hypothetical protein
MGWGKERVVERLLVVLIVAAGVATGSLISLHDSAPLLGVKPAPVGTSGLSSLFPPSPPPSPSRSVGDRLVGKGPFVLYTVGDAEGEVRAIDLGTPGSKPIRLGKPPGQTPYLATAMQTWGTAVPYLMIDYTDPDAEQSTPAEGKTRVWMLSHGGGFDDAPVALDLVSDLSLSSPDSRQMLLMPGADDTHLDVVLAQMDGSMPRRLSRIYRGGLRPEEGDLTPLVWLPGGGWLAVPICACDYAAPIHWYTISPTGTVATADWLGFPEITPGTSRDGRFISYVEQPTRDCSTKYRDQTCPAGPARLFLADTVRKRVRELASYANHLGCAYSLVSPDGSRVAVQIGCASPIKILDARTGALLSTIRYRNPDATPEAFIDDETLLFTGTVERSNGQETRLYVARLHGNGSSITKLAGDLGVFLGWVR